MILDVYLAGNAIGNLTTHENGDIVFSYEPNASAISLSLQDTSRAYSRKECIPYFEGLLPEGEVRRQLATAKHISSSSTMRMLSLFGREIAGALSIVPHGESFDDKPGYYEVSEIELGRKIRQKEIAPLILCDERTKLSLAGAENKIPVLFKDGRFFLPFWDSPTNFIIKASGEFCENEFMCTRLAKSCNLPVCEVNLHDFDGCTALLIKRYDRFEDGGVVKRAHQEDFCQALGIMPSDKYEESGGPGFKECLHLISRKSKQSIGDQENFLKMAVFNFIIGNCDAHAKNFSFLYSNGLQSAVLAPFYDIVSSSVYDCFDRNLAMKPKHHKDLARIVRSDFYNLASPRLMDRIIDECVCDFENSVKQADFICNGQLFENIVRDAKSRIERLK